MSYFLNDTRCIKLYLKLSCAFNAILRHPLQQRYIVLLENVKPITNRTY